MTEYKLFDKEITEIKDFGTRNEYLEQAKEIYKKGGAYEMTFLPVADGFTDIKMGLVYSDWGGYKNQNDTNAYSYILQKTLEKTFEQGNPEHDSALIVEMSRDVQNDSFKPNLREWRSLTLRAINEHMRKDKEWFGKLTPVAQLAAIGLEICSESNRGSTLCLQQENGLNLDFSKAAADGFNRDLEDAANLVLSQAYRRVEYGNILQVEPLDNRLSWEVKAAALEAQLKSRGNIGKIPSVPVFVDLLKTAETSAQQLKLAELAKEPDFKDALRYSDSRRNVSEVFKDVAARGEATQKLFYEVMYNFRLDAHLEPKLSYNAMNYQTLQEAKNEVAAQKSVDEVNKNVNLVYNEIAKLNKKLKEGNLSQTEKNNTQKQIDEWQNKEPIQGIANIELVAKYRPQFLEQSAKMTPNLCAQIISKYGDKLPAQTQLEMMTKVVANNNPDFDMLGNYADRAAKLNTSSKAMGKFIETLRPAIAKAQKAYNEDKQYLSDAAVAKKEYEEANAEWSFLKKTRVKYVEINGLVQEIKLMRDEIQAKEPSDGALKEFMDAGIAGKKVELSYEPKKIMGLFMKNKDKQMRLQSTVAQLNLVMGDAQASEMTAEYLPKVTDDVYNKNFEMAEQKFNEKNKKLQEFYLIESTRAANTVAAFERSHISEKFAALEQQFEQRSKEMQGRARTDLAMQFDGQEFDGKPMAGLVKEDNMAQDIYKKKITELRQSIKDGVKQDMDDRDVNKTPDKENPNATGKPMTAEGTKKIRRDMKDLKQYKSLIHE